MYHTRELVVCKDYQGKEHKAIVMKRFTESKYGVKLEQDDSIWLWNVLDMRKLDSVLKDGDAVDINSNGRCISGILLWKVDNSNFWLVEDQNGHRSLWNEKCITKKEKAMEFKLPNGAVLTGTPEQVISTAKMLGYSVDDSLFYNSSTHGRVLINEMSTHHLKNALLKMYRDWAASLSGLSEKDLVLALRNGCTDKTFINLLAEYVTRIK